MPVRSKSGPRSVYAVQMKPETQNAFNQCSALICNIFIYCLLLAATFKGDSKP